MIRKIFEEERRFAAHWQRFLDRYGKEDPGPVTVLDVLLAQYGAPTRHYHHYWHINDGLDLLEEARRDMPEWFADRSIDAAIELAFFEHDAVYDAALDDNEERSEHLAIRHAHTLDFDSSMILKLIQSQSIRATTHRGPAPTLEAQIVCDVDLAALAAPWEAFCRNTRLVRLEYRHVRSETVFAKGRREFFAGMLDREKRPHIYQTGYFRARFEAAARENLERVVRDA